jgi:hypothetical protein
MIRTLRGSRMNRQPNFDEGENADTCGPVPAIQAGKWRNSKNNAASIALRSADPASCRYKS